MRHFEPRKNLIYHSNPKWGIMKGRKTKQTWIYLEKQNQALQPKTKQREENVW